MYALCTGKKKRGALFIKAIFLDLKSRNVSGQMVASPRPGVVFICPLIGR